LDSQERERREREREREREEEIRKVQKCEVFGAVVENKLQSSVRAHYTGYKGTTDRLI
jgi:hypothetical protein